MKKKADIEENLLEVPWQNDIIQQKKTAKIFCYVNLFAQFQTKKTQFKLKSQQKKRRLPTKFA